MGYRGPPTGAPAILVVEDEVLVRMDVADALAEEGFEVLEAANSDEAIRVLEKRSDIRLVFTDVNMPGSIDGLKLAAYVRDRWPPIALILTSGDQKVRPVIPEQSVFFPKPYDLPSIVAKVRDLAAR